MLFKIQGSSYFTTQKSIAQGATKSTQISKNQEETQFQNNVGNTMSKAIKDYKDELLTGLTEDEKKEIEEAVKSYLEEHPNDKEGLKNMIKQLLKEYGFKGDFEQYLTGDKKSSDDSVIAYNKLKAKMNI